MRAEPPSKAIKYLKPEMPKSESATIPFEAANLRAYALLLRIEIGLRECLNCSKRHTGSNSKRELQGELLKKIRQSQTDENKPQFDFIRLGPLYYLTLGELLTQLQQGPARSVTEKFGGEKFLKLLESIFLPRNALCHSRPVSSVGLKTIETVYAQMEAALTADGFARLIATPDIGLGQSEAARALISSLRQSNVALPTLPSRLDFPGIFETAHSQFWWIDEALAGFQVSPFEIGLPTYCRVQ